MKEMKKYFIKVTTEVDYNTLEEFDTIVEVIYWLDKMLFAVNDFSLMSELNDLQRDSKSENGESLFPDKFRMPLKIYNYILQKFNLKIVENF